MNLEHAEKIMQALAVACELTDTVLSDTAKAVMVEDLAVYELADVLAALNRCRRELTGKLTLAAILQRMDCGLIGADEAFGLLVDAEKNEALTVVVPEIALLAMGQGAQGLLNLGDKTGARMAFKAAYERLANEVQDSGKQARWMVSAGTDKAQTAAAINEAVRLGRLPESEARFMLPSLNLGVQDVLALPDLSATDKSQNRERVAALKAKIAALAAAKINQEAEMQAEKQNQRAAFANKKQQAIWHAQQQQNIQAA